MKLVSLIAVCGLAAASPVTKWENFKRDHLKVYKSFEQETKRFGQFQKNLQFIEEHNLRFMKGHESFHVAINKFADLSSDEFARMYLADMSESPSVPRKNYQCPVSFKAMSSDYADSVDWTTTDNPMQQVAVTMIKDQGQCGSCWSFATTGTFEGQECLSGNQDCTKWHGASEQNLVDCSVSSDTDLGPYYDMGCNGGWIDNGLYYIQVNGGVDSEDGYPYTSGNGRSGSCKYDSSDNIGREQDCGATTPYDENELMQAIHDIGPIGVAIDASGSGFQLYSGGIYSNSRCSTTRLNHAVLAVGFGDINGEEFFNIKNSWGNGWGDSGFIKFARNAGNMCGVATTPAYAQV